MQELPLFPLNSVLFPGMFINLHIFEEHYKLMIHTCLKTQQPFGVVLIAEGQEAFGAATPHSIGCTAHITRMQPLEEGRMDITAVGRDRFTIQSLLHDRPYLVGMVEMQTVKRDNIILVARAAQRLRPWVVKYLEILSRIEKIHIDPANLPTDPVAFAYLAAALLQQISLAKKQDLLSSSQALDLLAEVRWLYQFEVTLLEMMAARAAGDDTDPLTTFFSAN